MKKRMTMAMTKERNWAMMKMMNLKKRAMVIMMI
jgi:hypothetical protein